MATLTPEQLITLADDINANTDPDVVAARTARNDTELARLYNLDSSIIVWRDNITPSEYREALVWTEIDSLTAGKARIWEWITQNMTAPIDATKANIRQGLADVFPSNGATRGQLLTVAKESASVFESIYAAGVGTTANPAVRVVNGPVTIQNIGAALNG